ncbi:MAG: AMP-binding protein [Ilumatobacteraceae bacterium]|jgi:fatty-acyl-CoA synthase|nr:AMP-binding protein [Ilumatobacteraceae bacterium]
MTTFADHIRAHAGDDNVAVVLNDDKWTYREWVRCIAERAALFESMRRPGPAHIGVLMDNHPEFTMWIGVAAVTGATVVGLNSTRRGSELQRDVTFTDCQMVVTHGGNAELLEGLDLGPANGRVLVVDTPDYAARLAPHSNAQLPSVEVDEKTNLMFVFTSGSTGAPKAVIVSHGRLDMVATSLIGITNMTADDVTYMAMPLFHSNALMTAWAPTVKAGATLALREKFSASQFMPDVVKYGATYFNYVGRPLAYVLATPPSELDRKHKLRIGFGNEGGEQDIAGFKERFGVPLVDGYGQSETGASINRVQGMPPGALGRATSPDVKVLNPDTGEECPPARFDVDGKLLNAEEATGEIVNLGYNTFEGYYNNTEANAERSRNGAYWTGDLAYRDADGFFYFAGRNADWIRVDGENFAAAPIDRIVARYPGIVLSAAYGVPDPEIGDRVMVALQFEEGHQFDIESFSEFLATQPDMGTKWMPTFIRVMEQLPLTQTTKVLKRQLVLERWHSCEQGDNHVWWRPTKGESFTKMTVEHAAQLREKFVAAGRGDILNH